MKKRSSGLFKTLKIKSFATTYLKGIMESGAVTNSMVFLLEKGGIKFKLCFRYLGDDHRGQTSARTIVCEINGCTDNHNRLLYESKGRTQEDNSQPVETGPATNQKETANSTCAKSETKFESKSHWSCYPPRSLVEKERDRTRLRQQTVHMAFFVLFEQFLWS